MFTSFATLNGYKFHTYFFLLQTLNLSEKDLENQGGHDKVKGGGVTKAIAWWLAT